MSEEQRQCVGDKEGFCSLNDLAVCPTGKETIQSRESLEMGSLTELPLKSTLVPQLGKGSECE